MKTYKMASTIHEIALWATLLAYVVTVLLASGTFAALLKIAEAVA
jgi:hypothetical protein